MIGLFYINFKSSLCSHYFYGFNGQEKDREWLSGAVAFKYRVHDPRLGRFFSVDPLSDNFPWNSQYCFSENRVIDSKELEGAERISIHVDSHPNKGTSGKAKITISLSYKYISEGQGKLTKKISPTSFKKQFDKGDGVRYMNKLPSPGSEGEFLEGKYLRWAKRAEKGKTKYADKLQEAEIEYYKVEVDYDISISAGGTICDIAEWMQEDPDGRGIVAEPIKKSDMMKDMVLFDIYRTSNYATEAFRDPETGGLGANEKVFLTSKNIIIMNPKNVMELSNTKISVHEAGHNMAYDHYHDADVNHYTYKQGGLQSNSNPFPTNSNTETIINDKTNRQTITTTETK